MRAILFGGGLALLISLLGTRVAITWFTRWGWGQEIRDDGPTSHHTKRGTPTMGGLVIIFSVVVGYFAAKIITQSEPSASALLLLFLFVGLGAVGFLDDFIKIRRQRSLGLRSRAKMIGQTVVALVFGVLALWHELADSRGNTPASTHVSFLRDIPWLALPTVRRARAVLGDHHRHQQRDEPRRRPRRPVHRRVDPGVRRLHAGQHLAEQPELRDRRRAHLLRGARPARPRRRRGRDHRGLLRVPVVERLAGGHLHG